MRSDKNLLKPEGHIQFLPFKNPAWVVMLFLFGSGFIVQGCVVHTHDNRHARHKTKIYSNKNYQRHKQQDAQYQKPAPRRVKKIPFEEQHPSHVHQPPAHAKAYDVAKGKPFTEDEHPSSHGRGHKADQGKPDKGDHHPSVHAKADKGKPLGGDEHPSSKGRDHKADKGKPDKGDEHPSVLAKADKGKPSGGDESPAPKGQNHKAEKGKPLRGDGSPASQAKTHQEPQGGPRQGKAPTSAQLDTPKSKGKSMMDAPQAKRPDSSPMKPGGKPDKGGPKSKGNPEDRFAASPVEENMPSESFSQPANKGRSFKQDSMASPVPSDHPDFPTVEASPEPRENMQIAKAEPVRGKGPSKPSGKPSQSGKGKPNRAPEQTAAVTPQKPAPAMAAPEMSIASVPPAVFDTNQRNIIQSYYQNSGSTSPAKGKGKGKSARKSKRNTTRLLAKNDIVTQPTEPLPRNLESQLPPAPPNTRRVLYQQQVLLVEKGSNRVLDVIDVNN
ncbi:MAG: hypothetical protein IH923_02400 [Nitrospinae bacterium]|nr:hypothetical protein [Nitrospinota bacterium]